MNDVPAYLNGQWLPLAEARVPVLDRGFLFADGVYEMIPIHGRTPLGLEAHLVRLEQSLAGLRIDKPLSRDEWTAIVHGLRERVPADETAQSFGVYLQVTRGAGAKRAHVFPPAGTPPTVFAMINPVAEIPPAKLQGGLAAITAEDIRWDHCHWKTTALLANVLLQQRAVEAGADEAILLRDGRLTEGTQSNIYVVRDGIVLTPPLGPDILPGVTRQLMLDLAAEHGIELREETLDEAQLRSADEIWISSSTRGVLAITRLDGEPLGNGAERGRPGPLWREMRGHYENFLHALRTGS